MALAHDFQFSQSNLQDFTDCPRRFELRHMQRLKWPALEAEPALEHERRMRQGDLFHRTVHQHIIGVPAEQLTPTLHDDTVRGWWQNYLRDGLNDLPAQRHPEVTLSVPFGRYRLLAKYDLLAVQPGERAVIVDWKTTEKRPGRGYLQTRLQTLVYRYVLARAGAHLNNGQPFVPEQVTMWYWFPSYPNRPEQFPYDSAQYQNDEALLLDLVQRIETASAFERTDNHSHCRFCTYRSLCGRGEKAGNFLQEEVDFDTAAPSVLDFDFDQIAEIAF